MPYIIFPGNVGEVSTLKEIVEELIWKIAWLQVFVYTSGKFQLRKSFNDLTSKFLVCFEQFIEAFLTESSKSPALIAKSNKQLFGYEQATKRIANIRLTRLQHNYVLEW